MTQFTRTVTTPAEYKEMKRLAEGLGFELININAEGEWETSDGEEVSPGLHIGVTPGRKYFTLRFGGDTVKCTPSNEIGSEGSLEMLFSDETK